MTPPRLIWDTYADTVIVRSNSESVLVGPNAVEGWPLTEPCHVITAWNPDSILTSDNRNRDANEKLEATIVRYRGAIEPVVGRSGDNTWSEDSFLVIGISRQQAVDIGRLFGQLAIFELDRQSVHVVRCDSGTVERTRPRIHQQSATGKS